MIRIPFRLPNFELQQIDLGGYWALGLGFMVLAIVILIGLKYEPEY